MNRIYTILIGLMLCLGLSKLAAQTTPTGLTATIPGSFSVNTNGSASYQIPIDLPNGAGGITPRLTLGYNSLAGIGLAGKGWSLYGLSAITRVGKDIVHDNTVTPVTFTNQDPLVLDGNRMILLSGTHFTAGAIYGTEVEGFAKIETIVDGTTVWFKVTQKDGTIMEYGSSANSRLSPTTITYPPYQWWLRKVTDVYGNSYEVEYANANNQIVPLRIVYSKSVAASTVITVDMTYSTTNQAKYYIGAIEFTQNKRLDNISVTVGTTVVRSYTLTYESITNAVQLSNVSLGINGVNNIIPQTSFSWNTIDTAYVVRRTTLPLTIDRSYGDFDGNGSVDLAINSTSSIDLYRWSGSDFVKFASTPIATGSSKRFTPDLDGDGLADLVCQTGSNLQIYQNVGSSFILKGTVVMTNYSSTNPMFFNDINGDGKTDLVWNSSNNRINFWIFNDYSSLYTEKLAFPGSCKFVSDFDGDGKSEGVIVSSPDSIVSYKSGAIFGRSIGYALTQCLNPERSIQRAIVKPITKIPREHFPGDFNGDGLTDFLRYEPTKGNWAIINATGQGFMPSFTTVTLPTVFYGINIADFDGDGADDIILQVGNPATKLVFYSPKNGTLSEKFLPSGGNNFNTEDFYDFDGDGQIDILGKTLVSVVNKVTLMRCKDQNPPKQIVSINRGDGFSYNIDYLSSRNSSFCARSFNTAYPISNFAASYFLVSKVTTPNGIGGTKSRLYSYANPKVHMAGLGYLGFEKFEEFDEATNTKITSTFNFANAHFESFLTQHKVQVDTTVSTESYTYESKNLTFGRYFSYASKITGVDHLKGITSTVDYTYDSYGNQVSESKTTGSFTTKTTASGFTGKIAPYLPRSITTEYLKEGTLTRSVTTAITYNAKEKVETQTQAGSPTKKFFYDAIGNVTRVEESEGSVTRFSTYSYDATGRFLTGTTNARSQNAYSVVNPTTGTTTTSVDINGYKTEYLYDALGRPTKVTTPSGTSSSYIYSWAVGEYPYSVKKTTVTVDGSGSSTEWYDILGRVIRKSSPAPGGKTVVVVNTYNSSGALVAQSLPGFSGPSTEQASFTYDAYGRLTAKAVPGKTTNITYSGNSVTESVVGGQSTTVTYNEVGLPALSSGSNGSVSFTYNGLGQPVDITAAGVKTTSYTYDYANNRQKVTNLNSGTSTVASNAWGQPTLVIDANGNQTTFVYDELGRLKTKQLPEGSVDYTYDETLKGALSKVSYLNKHTRTFGYNTAKYGRLESVSDVVDSKPFARAFAYNDSDYGRLQSVTLPGGFVVKYSYDAYGFNSAITKDDNSSIWTRGVENSLGQPLSYTLGNNLTQTFGYDQYHNIQAIGVAGIYSQGYEINPATDNLKSRRDILRGITESFAYDGADRLVCIKRGIPNIHSVSYATNGNITEKYDVGTYRYALTAHPNAVSEVTPVAGGALQTSQQAVTYNSYNKPISIAVGQDSMAITYGVDLERIVEKTYSAGALAETRYLLGDYELVEKAGVQKHYYYIKSPYGVVAVNIKEGTAAGVMHYLHADHLGSVVAITSATGAKEQEFSYDAWGRRRNPVNWSYDGISDPSTNIINRGYTFHQHYDKLGLINMNGRVYDPIVGRFLSVDPLVGNPLSAQDYNGYSYCANNPMKYTDPSGYTYWQYKDGEWSHFDYNPFQGGTANFREAASGGSNLRYGYEGPGQGRNGTGLSGYYYDWFSGSYRTTAGSRTPWSEVYYNAVVPNAFTLDFSVQLSKKIKPNPKLYNKPGNHDAEIKALIAKYYTAYKKQILGYHSDDTAPPGFEYNKENGTYTYIGPTTDYLNNGASVLGAQLDGVIYVSPYACDNTLNLTFSHELGHILLNDAGLTDVNKQECALYFSMYKLTYNQEYWLLYYHYGHRFPPRYGTIIDGIIRK